MWKRRTLELSGAQRKGLTECLNHDRRPDIRERCAAILKIAEGHAPYAVAREGLLKHRDPDTVYGWLDRYEEHGLEGLLRGRHGGDRRSPFRRAGSGPAVAATRAWT